MFQSENAESENRSTCKNAFNWLGEVLEMNVIVMNAIRKIAEKHIFMLFDFLHANLKKCFPMIAPIKKNIIDVEE